MPHFCGRTHSTRDRHIPLVGDDPRPAAGGAVAGSSRVATGAVVVAPAPATRPAAGAAPKPAAMANAPTHQQIAALAYSYWEARGRQGGLPEADWLRAEKELSTR